jgi:hypothetical protein
MTVTVERTERPGHRMWVVRFHRDGQPREIHLRRDWWRSDGTGFNAAKVREFARKLADETGSIVHYTMANVTANYGWQVTFQGVHQANPLSDPLWWVVQPRGMRTERRIEDCPNGCGRRPAVEVSAP